MSRRKKKIWHADAHAKYVDRDAASTFEPVATVMVRSL